jgi:hypothetical protein
VSLHHPRPVSDREPVGGLLGDRGVRARAMVRQIASHAAFSEKAA